MQTTKQQILALLKRTGAVTIEEAAGALSIASMTARQHLIGLELDGLITAEKIRRPTGRPHFLYSLTPKGDEMFPRRYDILAQLLLEEVGLLRGADIDLLTPAGRRSLLVQRSADRLADRFRSQVTGQSLEERVAAVTEVLHLIGGFAEWRRNEDVFEIRDFNCVFARLMEETESGCEWHVRLLTSLLHWPVRHEMMVSGRAVCCLYAVDPNATPSEEGLPH